MKLTKITAIEFNAKEEGCTERRKNPIVRQFRGDVPIHIQLEIDKITIPANTYRWLIFVPCELIGEINWIYALGAKTVRGLNGKTKPRSITPAGYKIHELENNGVIFGFA